VQGRDANEVTLCSIADCIAPSQQLADELTNCSGLKGEHLELTVLTNVAAELTTCSSAD